MPIESCHPLGNSKGFKRVLAYLRAMVQFCKDERHRDMEYEYELAIRFISAHVYGKLPPKKDYSAGIKWEPTPKPPDPPQWHIDKYSKPMRKVIERVEQPDGQSYEVLQCGHNNFVYDFKGYSEAEPWKFAKWRRCAQCLREKLAAEEKKPVQSESGNAAALARFNRMRFTRSGE